MRVIGAGLPRTGTLTQKVALEMLGFAPCYHWVNVIADLDQVEVWDRAMNGEEPWDEVFAGFQGTVDWPGGAFWHELADRYPDAKVLLSVRDAEKWEPSFRETIWNMCFGDSVLSLTAHARAKVDSQWDRYLRLVDRMFWSPEGCFPDGHETPEQLIAQFHRHNEAVKAGVPADRLLVWSVTEGWEPLCEFLEVPVPSEPLPHVNDRETFMGRVIDGALAKLGEWRAAEIEALSSTAA